jgi:acyl-CoA synthetase (AMP-forming)/AMP-acid ligase II
MQQQRVHATTHQGMDTDEQLPHPRPPRAAINALIQQYWAAPTRAGAAVGRDSELLCRRSQVMMGYRDDPGRTAEAIDADGWLHTGEIAAIDAEGISGSLTENGVDHSSHW